ncbi:MAG: TetR/AcrR family transcriptional regulator [Acidimicrobiales bacterium]
MAQVLKPEVRDRIVAAGLTVFSERGYRDAAMTDIAARAGVSTANIYRYYPNKSALFDAVLPDEFLAAHDQLLDARVGALATTERSADPATQLLDFWVEHRLAVATLLDHDGETSRTFYREAFVERLIDHVAATLDGPLGPLDRQLLWLVFDNTRRTLATILRSTDDPAQLRTAIEGFWSYQVPGLDGLLAWMGTHP